VANPAELWHAVSGATEDDSAFTRAVTEVVGLRLLRGRTELDELISDVTPILEAEGWSTTSGPITPDEISEGIWRPLRWWRLFPVLDEVKSTWERGTIRRLTPHTVALRPEGEGMVLAYLRSRAAGPRHDIFR
jgi:hypothetical protein